MSRFILPNGRVVQADTPFDLEREISVLARHDLDGYVVAPATTEIQTISYPAGVRGLATNERFLLGITEVVEQPMPDTRYGFASEDPANPGAWIFTPFDAETLKQRLVDYARNKTWALRVGGFEINGVRVATDGEGIALLGGLAQLAQQNPSRAFNYDPGGAGRAQPLTGAQAMAFSAAVGEWVQSTFDLRTELLLGIDAGTITTFEAIDETLAG
jgi:hypothetical protein